MQITSCKITNTNHKNNPFTHIILQNMSGGLFFMDYEIMMNGNVKIRSDGT